MFHRIEFWRVFVPLNFRLFADGLPSRFLLRTWVSTMTRVIEPIDPKNLGMCLIPRLLLIYH
jgi:hypothetical protein